LLPKNWDFDINRVLRRRWTPQKKWSRFEKWLGASINAPLAGTLRVPIARVR
jgi:hypothetical protein